MGGFPGEDIIASVIGGGMKMLSNSQQNEANEKMFQETSSFNAQEADKARTFSAGQQLQAEDYNANQAELNRVFQNAQSSTAYQRATADMKAAGINPMVAYQQGGASTPGGSSASVGAVSGPSASVGQGPARAGLMSDVISSAAEGARLKPTLDNLRGDLEVKGAQKENLLAGAHQQSSAAALAVEQANTQRKVQEDLDDQMSKRGKDVRGLGVGFNTSGLSDALASGLKGVQTMLGNVPAAATDMAGSAKDIVNFIRGGASSFKDAFDHATSAGSDQR